MKVYKCYRKYPAESADVTIYVLDNSRFYPKIVVEFFGKDPLEEPFSRKWCDNFIQGTDIAEDYIKKEGFEKVEIGA